MPKEEPQIEKPVERPIILEAPDEMPSQNWKTVPDFRFDEPARNKDRAVLLDRGFKVKNKEHYVEKEVYNGEFMHVAYKGFIEP